MLDKLETAAADEEKDQEEDQERGQDATRSARSRREQREGTEALALLVGAGTVSVTGRSLQSRGRSGRSLHVRPDSGPGSGATGSVSRKPPSAIQLLRVVAISTACG